MPRGIRTAAVAKARVRTAAGLGGLELGGYMGRELRVGLEGIVV
jgi:hypothetical protein